MMRIQTRQPVTFFSAAGGPDLRRGQTRRNYMVTASWGQKPCCFRGLFLGCSAQNTRITLTSSLHRHDQWHNDSYQLNKFKTKRPQAHIGIPRASNKYRPHKKVVSYFVDDQYCPSMITWIDVLWKTSINVSFTRQQISLSRLRLSVATANTNQSALWFE